MTLGPGDSVLGDPGPAPARVRAEVGVDRAPRPPHHRARPRPMAALIAALVLAIASSACTATTGDESTVPDPDPVIAEDEVSSASTEVDGRGDGSDATGASDPDAPSSAGSAGASPNVLLIILDDIGLDYFPGYLPDVGFQKAPMPTIEGLMAGGHVFENLHTYPTCSPTRASLLTGRHGIETGVVEPGRTSLLDTGFRSIQSELKARSDDEIATAVFGKWHLVGNQADGLLDHPNRFGIDHYAGLLTGTHESYGEWPKVVNGEASTSTNYSTTDFTDDTIDWIADQDGQWFTWLAYTAPHSPIHLPPAELHSRDDLTGTERDIRRSPDIYFEAMLESVDTEIGRLLDSFDEETRANTFVLLIGDNGTGGRTAQEPYASIGVKGSLHVGGITTPMVVHDPYRPGSGRRHDPLISTIDFFPTVLDLFGLGPAPDDLVGNSFASLITSGDDAEEAADGGYTANDHVFSQNDEAVAVRAVGHKLIRFDNGEERFHALGADPFEQVDLLATGTGPEADDRAEYERLSVLLDRYLDGDYGP